MFLISDAIKQRDIFVSFSLPSGVMYLFCYKNMSFIRISAGIFLGRFMKIPINVVNSNTLPKFAIKFSGKFLYLIVFLCYAESLTHESDLSIVSRNFYLCL